MPDRDAAGDSAAVGAHASAPRRRPVIEHAMEPATASPPAGRTSLVSLVEREKRRRRRRIILWLVVGTLVPGVALGVVLVLRPGPLPMAARFRTARVAHGPLVREVHAIGRLEAVSSVSVGAEISGRIATVLVDYNDRVDAGQVLAEFDRAALEAQRAQSQAQVAAARAQLAQAKVDFEQARRNRARADEMFRQGGLSSQEHEGAVSAAAISEARLGAAQATVAAHEAAATIARTNLDHAIIRAPIDGVVITRAIDPGQTVASLLQAPVLFTVAADLRKMEVEAAIDEADIGEVAKGQEASFTVNAHPERVFRGVVTEVRNSPRVVQDVVTYGAVVTVENLDLALKPGMTASVRIRTARTEDTDSVPSAALRFTPPGEERVPGLSRVWLLQGTRLVAITVDAGLSDGESTAISGGVLPLDAGVLVDLTPEGKRAYGLVRQP